MAALFLKKKLYQRKNKNGWPVSKKVPPENEPCPAIIAAFYFFISHTNYFTTTN